ASSSTCSASESVLRQERDDGVPVDEDPVPARDRDRVRRAVQLLVVPPPLRGRHPRVHALAHGMGGLATLARGAPGRAAAGRSRPAQGADAGGGGRRALPATPRAYGPRAA